jgi:hypothetical protein
MKECSVRDTGVPPVLEAPKLRAWISRAAGTGETPVSQINYFFFCSFAHESRNETARLNTGAPGLESTRSATK